MIPSFVSALCTYGLLEVLFDMLETDMDKERGPAECAASALARMAASDGSIPAMCVDAGVLDKLVRLLEKGCDTAREQSAKAILIICEEQAYRVILLQVCMYLCVCVCVYMCMRVLMGVTLPWIRVRKRF